MPNLNHEKFFIHNNIRYYRTGDLAVLDSDFGFIYKGRIDRQVKVNGYRIELQDVEAAIQSLIRGDLCSVVPFQAGSDVVVGGLVAALDSVYKDNVNIKELQSGLKELLPSYMIPSKFIFLKEIPLNINGKVDHNLVKKQVKALLLEFL
jgi:D-alanine--poly(phosphoribitol) ligase subunit 1